MSENSQEGNQKVDLCFGMSLVKEVVEYIVNSFEQALKVKELMKYLSRWNALNVHELNEECVAYFYLEGESRSQNLKMNQDIMPAPVTTDNLIAFHIKVQESQEQKARKNKEMQPFRQSSNQFVANQSNQKFKNQSNELSNNNNSLNYSLSQRNEDSKHLGFMSPADKISEFEERSIYKQCKSGKNPQEPLSASLSINPQQQLSSSLSISNNGLQVENKGSSQLIPLKLKEQKVDVQLQNQLQSVKKHLYVMRRYRKISIQEERQRLQKLNKKKLSPFFGKNLDHSYDYDGSYIELTKPKNIQPQLITEMKPSLARNHSHSFKNSKRHSLNSTSMQSSNQDSLFLFNLKQQEKPQNPQRKLTSRQQYQKISFSNNNQRQVSHLPFIVLKDNTKIVENKKELSGSNTMRNSLNRSKMSQNSTDLNKFKSFAQLEQEKRLQKTRQKALELTETNELLQVDILPPTLNINPNSEPIRKQSKMMQKYLRKLHEEKTKIEQLQNDFGQKSVNFEQLKVPQRYAIQRYYQYDYEGQKQAFEFEITSKMSSKRNSIHNLTTEMV